ncbi:MULTISPECIES: DMT family transporter [Paracoccus]|uniref:DMT family transporter n=1 Tax=Paracoccus TaxID=265 RepID=UPI001FB7566F|nr:MULTISPECIES: DMT family transporter [Paracoccus]MCJ1899447.1 DMT family transporter [Paracoccus versutus]MDF3904828.1 DMT family transporter [Paracoccus sp. AS002]
MVTENFRGAILMVLSMALFAFEDMFVKLMTMGLPYAQVLAMVGGMGFLAFWASLLRRRRRFWTRQLLHPLLLLRNLGEVVGAIGFTVALALSELSSTSAILQALPLFIVLGAALFLGEPVGWRRCSAIAVGFAGVLLIVRPGFAGFQPVSLMALLAVVALVVRDLATRRIPDSIPSDQIAGSAFLAIMLGGLAMWAVLGQPLARPGAVQLGQLAGCMVVGVGGYALLVAATRIGEASAIAPYRYSRLVFALILAFLVFDERPDLPTLLGAGLIVASGCYTMWREAALRRRRLREAGFASPC